MEWISVEDKLPKDQQEVLVYKNGRVEKDMFRIYHFDHGWLYTIDTSTVTHWMPLPEPPSEPKAEEPKETIWHSMTERPPKDEILIMISDKCMPFLLESNDFLEWHDKHFPLDHAFSQRINLNSQWRVL